MNNTPEQVPAPEPNDNPWRLVALVLLPIVGILLVLLAIVLLRPREPGVVTAIIPPGPNAPAVNTGTVIDATDPDQPVDLRLGYRYRIFIEDESEDRSSGIAHINGRATFVPDARRGQTILADVTRVRERVVDAVLVRVLSKIDLPPKPTRPSFRPRPEDPVVEGAEFDVVISEESSKNPGVEGIARINGLVVIVSGAPTVGQRANVRITERRERIAFAELTGKPAGTDPLPERAPAPRQTYRPRRGDPSANVVEGAEFSVVIAEESSKNPGVEGIARINGLVVVVNGVPTPGQRVDVRITERRDRIAFAEPVVPLSALLSAPVPAEPARPAVYTPPADDSAADVVEGAVLSLTIEEPSKQRPDTEGVARHNGLVIFVAGANTPGQTVTARITSRRPRVAFAEIVDPE